MLTSARAILLAAAAAWHPVEHPPTPEWVAQEVRLPAETTADPGPFDLAGRPYWREPLAQFDDPEVHQITIMGDAQGGKTVLISAALISRSHLDPAPSMLAGPDQDAMRELRDKVYDICEASPAMETRIPPVHLRNDRWLDFGSMYCYLAFSGSKQRLRGRTCKFVFCTEVDVWQDDPVLGQTSRLIKARTNAWPEHKVAYESTPTDETSTIAKLYRESDQRKFQVPCPHCRHYQELRFFPHKSGPFAGKGGVAGLQDENGRWLSADEARKTAYYVCEQGCRIESHEKDAMVERGVWVPLGCRVDKRGRLQGTPAKSKRHVGYAINALYHGINSFGTIAADYLDARESGTLREFFNNRLGLPYSTAQKLPGWKELGRRLMWQHRRGTVPAEAWFLTATADVQSDRVYWAVRGFGDRKRSWQIDWGVIKRDENDAMAGGVSSDLAKLRPLVIDAIWPVAGGGVNPLGRRELQVRLFGIDTNYRMFEVCDFVRSCTSERVRAIRGDHAVDPQQLWRMTTVEKNARTGKIYEGGLQLWGIASHVYRSQLVILFGGRPADPNAFLFSTDVLIAGEDYLKQLVNQPPQTVVNEKTGKSQVRWITRDRGLGEHYWDCEVGNMCLADMVTGGPGNWDASKWPRPATKDRTIDRGETEQLAARANLPDDFSAR
jgi:phage terminase large subunit GpA-like protein